MSDHRRHVARQVGIAAALLLAAACTSSSTSGSSGSSSSTAGAGGAASTADGITAAPFDGQYRAVIRRTAEGVPHITGANVQSATFGQGYASAEDYACTLADQMVRIQGRRAEFLGAGDKNTNIDSDFAWRTIGIDALARKDYPAQSAAVKDEMTAFAKGWDRYLAVTGADKVNGWCASAAWLTPISAEDLYAYARSIALNASSTQLTSYLGKAQPPAPSDAVAPAAQPAAYREAEAGSSVPTEHLAATTRPTASSAAATLSAGLAPLTATSIGSNGWAIGKDRSADGGGLLLANPHFPWEGQLRFWEVQLTVPGQLNVYGVQLQGLPGVGIGFTDQFAWTHTVSAGNRFTAYTLTLVPGTPTSYVYDDTEHKMTSRDETIKVRQADGSMMDQKRTLWFSEYGPILDFPGVGWTAGATTTFRDANLDNTAFIQQYLDMDTATSFDAFKEAHAKNQGVPLFNTIAVSRDGRAWYADTSATPELSADAISQYTASLQGLTVAAVAAKSGAVVLDGSKSVNQWVTEPGARSPGLIPYTKLPQTERSDYVFNANDSYWLSNADHLLTGAFSPLNGKAEAPVSPRTRENAAVLSDTGPTGASGADGKFDLTELQAAALHNHALTSDALKDAVVARCQATSSVAVPVLAASDGTPALPAETVDLAKACSTLQAWDGTYDLNSKGVAIWREFIGQFKSDDLVAAGSLWAQPFDPAAPARTPSGLAPSPAGGPDPVLVNLGRSVQIITKAGFPLDATLGDVQHADRNGTLVPLHGAGGSVGVTNVVDYSGSTGSSEPFPKRGPTMAPGSALTAKGYLVNNGTSFMMTIDFTADGPKAAAFLTYGETEDRTSPLFSSQTKRFSAKDWRPLLYTEAAIAADPGVSSQIVTSS